MKHIVKLLVLTLIITISYSSVKIVKGLGESLVCITPIAIENVVDEVSEIEIDNTVIVNMNEYQDLLIKGIQHAQNTLSKIEVVE